MSVRHDSPWAVVVGLCAHGLAIARSLHRRGIRVIALEANPDLPGTRTKHAQVRFTPDINSDGLPKALLDLRQELGGAGCPVLFLTNDRMVETLGRTSESMDRAYRISWWASRKFVLPLLNKESIELRCREVGLNYPRTRLLTDLSNVKQAVAGLRFPVIVKPTRPLSAFKTIVIQSPESLFVAESRMARSLPVIVQEFVPGDDFAIRFGALYLADGAVVARFEGRKLRSRPMGHTTIAVSSPDDEIHELTLRFFRGLPISGPVSLELKRDLSGSQWVIEPTVGRTDFWVGLCIANGVDLPYVEYCSQAFGEAGHHGQTDQSAWVNGERDPAALAWLLTHAPKYILRGRVKGVYADMQDPRPFGVALMRYLRELPVRGVRKATGLAFHH